MVGLGVKKLQKDGPRGAKMHLNTQDLDLTTWKPGDHVSLSFDADTNTLTVQPVEFSPKVEKGARKR